MAKFAYDPKELNIVGRAASWNPARPGTALFDFPVQPKEAHKSLALNHEHVWMPYGCETGVFCPDVIPDNRARGFVYESKKVPVEEYGGPDMFGVQWVYVPVVGGSMERPGDPHPIETADEWKTNIKFPDPYAWDWDESAKANKEYLDNGRANMFWFLNGAGFERLVSFFGFENAAVALVDEEQEDDLKELLCALTDLHIKMMDCAIEAYGDGISGFCYHDDWGSQKAPFFSFEAGKNFFVPEWQRITGYIRGKGMIADLHSCGHTETQVQNYIDGGWMSWTPMPMKDTHKLYEEYGDKIVIGVVADPLDPDADFETSKAAGKAFAEKFCKPGKVGAFSTYTSFPMNDGFAEGMYETSRQI